MKTYAAHIGVIERAFAIAQSGKCTTASQVVKVLKKEGYPESQLEGHLNGKAVRKELVTMCRKAQLASAEPV